MIVFKPVSLTHLQVLVTDEHRVRLDRILDAYSVLKLSEQKAFLQPAADYFNGRAVGTQISTIDSLGLLGTVIKRLNWTRLPSSDDEWQSAVFDLFTGWLTRPSAAKLSTKVDRWNGVIKPYLIFLRDAEDLIPISVVIPEADDPESANDFGMDSRLITEGKLEPVENFVEKLITPISLARSDAAYLDEIRDELAYRRKVLEESCLKWWGQIESHFRYGQQVRAKINWLELSTTLQSGRTRHYQSDGESGGLYHLLNGDTEHKLGGLLTAIEKWHGSLLSKKTLETSNELPSLRVINLPSSAPPIQHESVTKIDRLYWMMGCLSSTDIAFAVTLLVLKNPKLTPSAILTSKLVDKHGKSHIEIGDLGISFRVDKRRAHSMKDSVLDSDTARILNLIVEMNEPHRKELLKEGSTLANMTFLTTDRGKRSLANYYTIHFFLSGPKLANGKDKNANWMGTLYPEIVEAGMRAGTLSLKKIRATEGVLEWFRTGSVAAMARKIGNSTRVSIEHYLPKPLLRAWNVRILRRFQNLWIAVATANEPFHLSVTDFSTIQELHEFILDMLTTHPRSSSPLAETLHELLSDSVKVENTATIKPAGQLSIPASTQTLLSLYLYQESAIAAGVPPRLLGTVDKETGISPRQIIAVAELIRSRADSDRNPAIRSAHEKALQALPNALKATAWPSLFVSWGRLYGI